VRLLLPCKCRDRGEEDFWNLLPAHPLLLYLPTCLTTYTTHTLINEETGDPCPSPWRKEGHALQRLHMSHPTPPCPALEQVWWPSPSTFYKYKGRLQDKGGGQNFGEGEKQTIDSRGEYAEKKERKKRAVTEETERERQRIVWREIRWQKQREEEERPQPAAATPTPPGAQTQQHCPCHSQPSSAHHLPPTRCCTIEEKAATCASARGRRRRKPLLSSGFPATATFITRGGVKGRQAGARAPTRIFFFLGVKQKCELIDIKTVIPAGWREQKAEKNGPTAHQFCVIN